MVRFLTILFVFLSFTAMAQKEVYLFSYFVDNGQNGLHLAYSTDGLKWSALNDSKSYLAPTVGKDNLMRDPFILQGKDDLFHMVWTSGWWDKQIGYAESKDLIYWLEQKGIPVMEYEPAAKNSWAPEMVYDSENKDYIILLGNNHSRAAFGCGFFRKRKGIKPPDVLHQNEGFQNVQFNRTFF